MRFRVHNKIISRSLIARGFAWDAKPASFRRVFSESHFAFARPMALPNFQLPIRHRFFSSSDVKNDHADEDIVFYNRSPERWLYPRVVLGFSTLHSAYWLWYVLDFIPAINSSPLESVHMSPTIGYLGLTVAAAVNFFAAKFPKSLVSKLALDHSGIVKVWVHNLPWVTLSTKPMEYHLGDIYLDPTASETKKIMQDHNGAVEQFRGLIIVYAKGRRIPLMLEVREDSEAIQNPQMFMDAMFDPTRLTTKIKKQVSPQQSRAARKQHSVRSRKKFKRRR